MPMKNPPHPGLGVRLDCLEPLGLSVTEGAKVLGVTRQALNNLVNCKSGLSPEMAIRLSKAFGGSPGVWLRLQMNYDLAQIERKSAKIVVKRMYPWTAVLQLGEDRKPLKQSAAPWKLSPEQQRLCGDRHKRGALPGQQTVRSKARANGRSQKRLHQMIRWPPH